MKRHCLDSVMQLLTEFLFFRASFLISVPFWLTFSNVAYANHPIFGTITILDSDTIFIKLWTENRAKLDEIWDLFGVSPSAKPESTQSPHLTFELHSNDSFRKMRLSLGGPNDEAGTKPRFLSPLFSIVPDLNSAESSAGNIDQHVTYNVGKSEIARKIYLNICKEMLIRILEKWYAEDVYRNDVDIQDIFRKVIRQKSDAQRNVELLGAIAETLQHAVNYLKRKPDSISKLIIDDTELNTKDTRPFLGMSGTTWDTSYENKNQVDKVRDTDNFRERSRLSYDSGSGRNFPDINNQRMKELILKNHAKTMDETNITHNINNFKKLWYCLNECDNRNQSIVSRNVTASSNNYPTHIYSNSLGQTLIQEDSYEDWNNNSRQAHLKQQEESHFPRHTSVPQIQNSTSRSINGSSTSSRKLNSETLTTGKQDNNTIRVQSSNWQRNTSKQSNMYKQELIRNPESVTREQSGVNKSATVHKLIGRKHGLLDQISNQQDFLIATRFRHDEVLNVGNKSDLTLKSHQTLQSGNSSTHVMRINVTDTERINLASSNEMKKHKDTRIKAGMRWFFDLTNNTQIAERIGVGWGGGNYSNLLSSTKSVNSPNVDVFVKDLKPRDNSLGTNKSANDGASFSKNNYTKSMETVRKKNTTSTSSNKNASAVNSFIKALEHEKKMEHAINSDVKGDKKSGVLSAMDDIVATVNYVFPSYQKKSISNKQDLLSHSCGSF